MCMFKKCEGPHACLLKNVSPCPTAPAGPANSNVRDGAAASVEDFLASRQVS